MGERAADCLDPADVQGFVAGHLTEAARERVECHIDECADCREVLAAIARSSLASSDEPTESAETVRAGDPVTDDTVRVGPGATRTVPVAPLEHVALPGTRIDRYVVLRTLGLGGMGIVVLARDPELRRRVVIKLVRPEMVDPRDTQGTRTRLLREAQAMAQVSHANVVPIYDVGTHADQVFIAMEYVEGQDLSRWLAEKQRTPAALLDVFAAAGRGLAAAHAVGLVHRDFKPHNVMVSRSGEVKVTDFGLARADLQPSSEEAVVPRPARARRDRKSLDLIGLPLTRTGAMVGTPAYMAPEQILGDAVDHRSDQFSFCVALYEAVCGQRPFAGDSIDAILQAALEGRIVEPTRNTRLPRRARDAIRRGLQAQPELRFPSMNALLGELTPARALRGWTIALGLAAAATAVALPIALLSRRDADPKAGAPAVCAAEDPELASIWGDPQRRDISAHLAAARVPDLAQAETELVSGLDDYATRWLAMSKDNCEATRVRAEQSEQAMADRAECLSRRRVHFRLVVGQAQSIDSIESYKLARGRILALPDISSCTADRLGEDGMQPQDLVTQSRVIALRARLSEADVQAMSRSLERAIALVGTVIDEAREISYAPLEAEAQIKLGRYQMYRGEWDEAAVTMTEAVQIADMAEHSQAQAEAQLALIETHTRLGRLDEAERYRRYARARLSEAGALEKAQNEMSRSLAEMFLHQGDVDQALEQHRAILARTESAFGKDSRELGEALLAMGGILLDRLGRYDEAIALFERSRDISARQNDESGQLSAENAEYAIQVSFHYSGRFDKAIAAGRKLIERGDSSRWVAAAHAFLALSYLEKGDARRAFQEADRSLERHEKQFGRNKSFADYLAIKALICERVGDDRSAEKLMRQALDIMVSEIGRDHDDTIHARNLLSGVVGRLGRHQEALELIQDGLDRVEKQIFPNQILRARTLERQAAEYVAAGQPALATGPAGRALEILRGEIPRPADRGKAEFTLARALWESGGDRALARAHAHEALGLLSTTIEAKSLGEVKTWLAEHGPGRK